MEWQNFYRKKNRIFYDFSLVIRSGFEPETHSLEGCFLTNLRCLYISMLKISLKDRGQL